MLSDGIGVQQVSLLYLDILPRIGFVFSVRGGLANFSQLKDFPRRGSVLKI